MLNRVLLWLMVIVSSSVSLGCHPPTAPQLGPALKAEYAAAEAEAAAAVSRERLGLVTISTEGMPAKRFFQRLSADYNVSVVWGSKFDDSLVSVSLQDVPVDDVLVAVGRRLGAEVTKVGSTWYLGDLKAQDRATLVRRVTRIPPKELDQLCTGLLADGGREFVTSEGILIAADRSDVLGKLAEVLERVEAVKVTTWVVELTVFKISRSYLRELGLDGALSVNLAAAIASGGGSAGLSSMAGSTFNALVVASNQNTDVHTVTSVMFLCEDGIPTPLNQTQKIPQAIKTVSDQGTVSVTNFVTTPVGVSVLATVRPVTRDSARLTVTFDDTSLDGFTADNLPITSGYHFEIDAPVVDGGVYLLGELRRTTQEKNSNWAFTGVDSKGKLDDSVTLMWGAVRRVRGPAISEGKPIQEHVK